jgi:type VI secretion system protein
MSRERTLLERFRDPEPETGSRTIHENTNRLAESVLRNLRRLLNSRHGVAQTRTDYGIPDMCDVLHNFPDAIAGMRKAIKTTIERYEPRLRRVNVKHVESPDDPQALHYEITAELVTEEEKASVWIETRIDGSGQVGVKG